MVLKIKNSRTQTQEISWRVSIVDPYVSLKYLLACHWMTSRTQRNCICLRQRILSKLVTYISKISALKFSKISFEIYHTRNKNHHPQSKWNFSRPCLRNWVCDSEKCLLIGFGYSQWIYNGYIFGYGQYILWKELTILEGVFVCVLGRWMLHNSLGRKGRYFMFEMFYMDSYNQSS